MRNLFALMFVLVSMFVVSGCFSSHGRPDFVAPMEDSGPFIGGDAGPTEPDAGSIAYDAGPTELDAGPTEPDLGPTEVDAGSDAGPVIESDAGTVDAGVAEVDAGSDAGPYVCPYGPANYYLNLGSAPLSSSVTAGEADVPSVGITLTTPPDTGITYTAFAILGRGDTDGTFRTEHFRYVVTSCSIFDGETRLGGGAPDERGLILVSGLSNHLDLGNSANLRVECDTDPYVAQLTGDRYVVALNGLIRDIDPVTVTDDHGCERISVWGRNLLNQLESANPRVVVTVTPDPFHIEAFDMRPSTILIGGSGYWELVASNRFDVPIRTVYVALEGDAANTQEVAIASGGLIYGADLFPSGVDTSTMIELDAPISPGPDGYGYFQVWVRVSYVQSGASVSGATVGVTRTGDTFRVGAYAVEYLVGTESAVRFFDTIWGNEFVIRKTKLTFVRETLSSTTLSNRSDQDFYKFRIATDLAGPAGIKGFCVRADIIGLGDILSLGFRRNGYEMSTAAVNFWTAEDGRSYIFVVFSDEETVFGSGNVYTLHGVVDGFGFGDSISIVPFRNEPGIGGTGYLGSGGVIIDGTPRMGGILWSDLSEVPHSSALESAGGSMDWTNEEYIEDMTQSSILSR